MKRQGFIFDFDGTLINSFNAIIEKFNLLAQEFNFRTVSSDEIKNIKNLTSRELIQHFGIPFYKLPKVVRRARGLLQADMHKLLPFKNIQEVIKELSGQSVYLGILTSNADENVKMWLKQHQIFNHFHFIHAESSYFGKTYILKRLIKNHRLNKATTFYIGDETRDIDAAKDCGIYSVAVTWGVGSEEVLKAACPDFLVKTPTEILDLLHVES